MIELTAILRKVGVSKERPIDTPTIKQAFKLIEVEVEFNQMITDNVYGEEVKGPLPRGANLVGAMWVLKIKRNRSTGEVEQYKARLVALGNQQDEFSYGQIKS